MSELHQNNIILYVKITYQNVITYYIDNIKNLANDFKNTISNTESNTKFYISSLENGNIKFLELKGIKEYIEPNTDFLKITTKLGRTAIIFKKEKELNVNDTLLIVKNQPRFNINNETYDYYWGCRVGMCCSKYFNKNKKNPSIFVFNANDIYYRGFIESYCSTIKSVLTTESIFIYSEFNQVILYISYILSYYGIIGQITENYIFINIPIFVNKFYTTFKNLIIQKSRLDNQNTIENVLSYNIFNNKLETINEEDNQIINEHIYCDTIEKIENIENPENTILYNLIFEHDETNNNNYINLYNGLII